jgi:hypothetical protein
LEVAVVSISDLLAYVLPAMFAVGWLGIGVWWLWDSARETVNQQVARALDIVTDPDEAVEAQIDREIEIAELNALWALPDHTPEEHR